MDIEKLRVLVGESLWWLGFALLGVLVFVGWHLYGLRKRAASKRRMDPEALAWWKEVNKKRKLKPK